MSGPSERLNACFFCWIETQHPRDDGRGERDQAAPGDRAAVAGREEVPAGGGEGRCRVHEAVSTGTAAIRRWETPKVLKV